LHRQPARRSTWLCVRPDDRGLGRGGFANAVLIDETAKVKKGVVTALVADSRFCDPE